MNHVCVKALCGTCVCETFVCGTCAWAFRNAVFRMSVLWLFVGLCSGTFTSQSLPDMCTIDEDHSGWVPPNFLSVPSVKFEPTWDIGKCHFLEKFYGDRVNAERVKMSPSVAPVLLGGTIGGLGDPVPVVCKPCEAERKDRAFVRGVAYTDAATRLLVDHASAHSGGKILSHSDKLRGVNDVLVLDDNRYLLTQCSNKVWFTIRLADEIFVDRVGLVASELFASTFRHIQILGSRQYPTSDWRVLGEIETNPMENQEWFDLSAGSECSKCYVRFVKIRVLTHHALEGYTNCALTRFQVFGSTVLQSLDKIQAATGQTEGTKLPSFVKLPIGTLSEQIAERMRQIRGLPPVPPPTIPEPPPPELPLEPEEDNNSPLLKFIEEMTILKRQYASVANNLHSLNETLKNVPSNVTVPSPSTHEHIVDSGVQSVHLVLILLVLGQIATAIALCAKQTNAPQSLKPPIFQVPFRKRTHGKSRIKRSMFSSLITREPLQTTHTVEESNEDELQPLITDHPSLSESENIDTHTISDKRSNSIN